MNLAIEVHRIVRGFPRPDRFRIGDQLAKAMTSVAANVAEGHGRRRSAEYVHFLDIANGSLCEAETQLEICLRLKLIDAVTVHRLLTESSTIGRMLTGLRRRLTAQR